MNAADGAANDTLCDETGYRGDEVAGLATGLVLSVVLNCLLLWLYYRKAVKIRVIQASDADGVLLDAPIDDCRAEPLWWFRTASRGAKSSFISRPLL
ncbi:hypothetical protein DIPPA_19219 [Diplonema papillatum]|nr:hypothetical protein DIPPA_19219 [Diplonema papillatum]